MIPNPCILLVYDWLSWLSPLADALSLVTFVFALVTAKTIRSIQADMLKRARLPDYRQQINEHMAVMLDTFPNRRGAANRNAIDTCIGKCKIDVIAASKCLPEQEVADLVSPVLVAIAKVQLKTSESRFEDADDLYAIHGALVQLDQHLKNVLGDRKLGISA